MMRWTSACTVGARQRAARLRLNFLLQLFVLDLVVALEGEPVDHRRFDDGHHQPAALLGDVNVLEQAGGVERLDARRRSWPASSCSPGADLEIGADRVGFDAAIALDNNRSRGRDRSAGAAYAAAGPRIQTILTPRSKPATTSPRLTRTHMSMRKAPYSPRGRPQCGGLLQVSLSSAMTSVPSTIALRLIVTQPRQPVASPCAPGRLRLQDVVR